LPSAGAGRGWLASLPRQADDSEKEPQVSNYTIDELIARWKREELTIEQVIGQILLLLKDHDRRLREAAPPRER